MSAGYDLWTKPPVGVCGILAIGPALQTAAAAKIPGVRLCLQLVRFMLQSRERMASAAGAPSGGVGLFRYADGRRRGHLEGTRRLEEENGAKNLLNNKKENAKGCDLVAYALCSRRQPAAQSAALPVTSSIRARRTKEAVSWLPARLLDG
ncbi:uncharacterized protein TRIVIDRAFT_221373 [Trichoderma virens Gv29-8]|uniref:Uncharacterized protein n=1 Tax=Hypocrea virens (strain Gv29-8 / FGSC 10586) TaxID=413071 RepID=G9MQR2_HYPVG|nr:uncharacterized protein TRIVIDRAFT_221373 [Trichoderma virens Gv29-8]EHK24129.1 hypothetical protein TRIVIDRAFT_221373 [Trichoderma virens Gv29-8]UKZ50439.1 hypothetical protein TrVGV298_004702 [Trichoderma virens]